MSQGISSKEFDPGFIKGLKIMSGQDLFQCIQCGKCSAACPMTESMEVLPRRVIRLAQLGLARVLKVIGTYWVCSSCQSCRVVCPRGIDLPRLMEALRLMDLRQKLSHLEPSQVPAESLRECPQIALVAAFRKLTA